MTAGLFVVPACGATAAQAPYGGSGFPDVHSGYWAEADINAMAAGGLVRGYSDGTFGPKDSLNIDQLATIIANAKGAYETEDTAYWAYDEVNYCVNVLRCLPDLGPITRENYAVPCTRELAVYMMTNGLGSRMNTVINGAWKLQSSDIPDFSEISAQYAPSVLKAYQTGLIQGVDEARTFLPKNILSRAEACTILAHAGYTKAADQAEIYTEAPAAEEIMGQLMSWDNVQTSEMSPNWLRAKDAKHGGITVSANDRGYITIDMGETYRDAFFKDGKYVDVNGRYLTEEEIGNDCCDPATGKFLLSSAWSYEGRQFVKDVFKVIFPASYEEAYDAMMTTLRRESYENPRHSEASALRWIDGRSFEMNLQSQYGAFIHIGPANDATSYREAMDRPAFGNKVGYMSKNCGENEINTRYELDRW